MIRRGLVWIGALPTVVAVGVAVYHGLYGSKKLAALAAALGATSVLICLLLRHQRTLVYGLCGLLTFVAAAVPFSETLVEQAWRRLRGSASSDLPLAPQVMSVTWSTKFAVDPPSAPLDSSDWPCWRGPHNDGIAAEATPPVDWSEHTNVVWRSDVPGRGYASPCVVGDRIILATADEAVFAQGLICYEASKGRLLWASRLHTGSPVEIHSKNSHASATPCSDGRSIYAVFLAEQDGRRGIWASAVDLAGNIRWQTYVGPFRNVEGYAPSPLCSEGLLYVAADGLDASYLAALDCISGDIRWKVDRDVGASYAGPVVADVAGRRQLLLTGNGKLISYDPMSGRKIWECGSLPQYCAGTPVWDDQVVYATGGSPDKALIAVRADGSGDVTETHLVWRMTSNVPYVPSLLLVGDILYLASDQGVLASVATKDGKTMRRTRLSGNVSASPSLADGRIYVLNEEGTAFVVAADASLKQLAENGLTPGGMATPAFAGDRVYLRTHHELFCITAPARDRN